MTVQPEVKKQTIQVAVGTALLSCLMLIVYALLGKFTWQAVLGALLGTAAVSFSFFLLGLSVQKAAEATWQNASKAPAPQEDEEASAGDPLPGEENTRAKATEVDQATRRSLQLSYTGRLLMLAAVAVLGWLLPCFDGVATVLPMLFPRIVLFFIGRQAK